MITAWVLLWAWGTNTGFAISGIATEKACKDLGNRMRAVYALAAPTFYCYEYQVFRPTPPEGK